MARLLDNSSPPLADESTITKTGNTFSVKDGGISGAKFGFTSQAIGDIIYHNESTWTRLPLGTAGQILSISTGDPNLPQWSTAKGIAVLASATDATAFATTYSIGNGRTALSSGSAARFLCPVSGTIGNLYAAYNSSNSLNGASVVTINVNGSDTAVTTSITAGSTSNFTDLVHTASVTAGQYVYIKIAVAGSSGAGGGFVASFTIQ